MISVIIPVYNCEKYLTRCVESILAQKYNGLEIIITNDGSTDNTTYICDHFAKREECITVIHQNNKGVSSARNVALERVKGEYVVFVDADDYLPIHAFSNLINSMKSDADLYMGSVLALGEEEPNYMYAKYETITTDTLAYEMMCTPKTRLLMSGVWGKLFRTEIIRTNDLRFKETLKNGEDGYFIADYMRCINRIVNIKDEPPVYYLMRYLPEERVSAVSAAYPDFFCFHLEHSRYLYRLIKDKSSYKMENWYQAFINELIIHLVRAYAYEDFFEEGELANWMNRIVEDELVRNAIGYYRRKNMNDSRSIPRAIRNGDGTLLDIELRKRAVLYCQNNKRKELISSIYRDNLLQGGIG